MYGTDSIIGQQAQYPIENGIPSLHRDVLEDDEGVNEIEFSFDGQEIVAFDESGVCNSKALAVAFRFPLPAAWTRKRRHQLRIGNAWRAES
jgi:hypothetical protein